MNDHPMILIIDDDPSVLASLTLLLKRRGHRSLATQDPQSALELLAEHPISLVIQDMNFSRDTSGREGLEFLGKLRKISAESPVILITAWGSIHLAVEGMKAGASDFITKPWSNSRLLEAVETALTLASTQDKAGKSEPVSRTELDRSFDFSMLVGEDPAFVKVLSLVARIAPTDASVLISGESGTGKELIAEALHRNGRRRDGPFVKVNLGGISSTLFESEMFGHIKGAFTDAHASRRGRFEVAEGGSILLDEIGEIDPSTQVKLLRVLQDRTYEVLGSSTTRQVDVRILSATNRDLGTMVQSGDFREDLLYRLNLISITLPPLRRRRKDIPLLCRHFLDLFARDYGRPPLEVDDRAMDWFESHTWPGNIRQLKQTLERAVLVLDTDRLQLADLLALQELETRGEDGPSLPNPGTMTLDEIEHAMIERCLDHYDGHITRVAEALGLSRAALYRRFKKYGLEPTRTGG